MKKIITLLLCLPLLGLSQNITDSLLLYYPMDGNTDDYSGNNFHGIPNGVTDTANRFGNPNSAYYFDGIDDFIDLPLTNTLKPQFPITFAFWAKVTVLGSQENKFFSTDFVQDNYHGIWMAVNYLGELNIHFGGGNGACNTTNRRGLNTIEHYIQPGQWYHFTGIIRNVNDMELYINCSNVSGNYTGTGNNNVGYSSVINGTIGRVDINATQQPYYYDGFLDEFSYWERALSSAEVNSLCDSMPIINTNRYDCLNGACVNLGQGVGLFSSLADCQLACQPLGIEDENNNIRKIRKIVDLLGREVNPYETQNSVLFYLYNDGTVEKKVIMQ